MRRAQYLHFADAEAEFDEAEAVVFGVPFDGTTSFRSGARFAPNAIREASYNFEILNFEQGVDLSLLPTCDLGNLEEYGHVDEMVKGLTDAVTPFAKAKKFPVILGGEHSLSHAAIRPYADDDLGVIQIDAHLDFRDEYLGLKNSHACASRRISDIVTPKRITIVGVRSISSDEAADAKRLGVGFVTAEEVAEQGIAKVVEDVKKRMGARRYALTVDTDGIDPAYAPAVGNPEPFGLTPRDVRNVIAMLGKQLVYFDIVEVSPPYDRGETAALAARLAREALAVYARTHGLAKAAVLPR